MNSTKDVFTTGQIARIFRVAPRTVSKWFDTGQLTGFRVPGSLDRRVLRSDLIRFAKKNGVPLLKLDPSFVYSILVIGLPENAIEGIEDAMGALRDTHVRWAETTFDGGVMAGEARPDCVVVDFDLGRVDASMIARHLHAIHPSQRPLMLGITSTGQDHEVQPLGYDFAIARPVDARTLSTKIKNFVAGEKVVA